ITRNTRGMGQLIDDLLAFSKISRQPIEKTRTDMSALVRSAIEDARRLEPERSIEFVVGSLPEAFVHPSLMKQVVDNLVLNAVKFTRGRTPARVEIGFGDSPRGPAYFVRDNGAGFDMAYSQSLFAPFQRLHRAKEFEGIGLGLATAQRIVFRHGGRIWAEAALGSGASFYFTLQRPTPSAA
ncbi:MAG: ATP-binding protein, partial [Polyangiaceae bacterium]